MATREPQATTLNVKAAGGTCSASSTHAASLKHLYGMCVTCCERASSLPVGATECHVERSIAANKALPLTPRSRSPTLRPCLRRALDTDRSVARSHST